MKFGQGMSMDDPKVVLKGQRPKSKVKVTRSEKCDLWHSLFNMHCYGVPLTYWAMKKDFLRMLLNDISTVCLSLNSGKLQ